MHVSKVCTKHPWPHSQVYYGVLRKELGGAEVAVKVQRPGVLEAVALDLMLIRNLAVALRPQVCVCVRVCVCV